MFEGWISSYSYNRSWVNCKLSISNCGNNQWLTKSNSIISKEPVENASTWLICQTRFVQQKAMAKSATLSWWVLVQMEESTLVHFSSKIKMDYRNFKINDIVLIQTDAARNSWVMGQILEINKDEINVLWSVKFLIGKKRSNFTSRILERPISKLVLLVHAENNIKFSDEEPKVTYQDVLTSWGEADEEATWWRNINFVSLWWRDIVFKKEDLFVSNLVTFLSYFDEICLCIKLFWVLLLHSENFLIRF